MQTYLAIDIGASSGRHILGRLEQGRVVTEEVYRFKNTISRIGGQLCWDLESLRRNVLRGLKRCAELRKIPASIGIDTWGVDFVLLDAEDRMLGEAVVHRDNRTQGMDIEVGRRIPDDELYARTGTQKRLFNTIYHLAAVQTHKPELLKRAARMLMIPEYLHFLLTGVQMREYTNATTTGLVNAKDRTWDWNLLDRLSYPRRLFGEIRMPGTKVGRLRSEIQTEVGFDCDVVLPPTHDTASAFLAVPVSGNSSVFLSSGTWSLLGVENEEPITTEASRTANFSNEGGYGYRYRFLKNIMGLWMVQRVRLDVGANYSEMSEMARASSFPGFVSAEADRFMNPDGMAGNVRQACAEAGQPVPETRNDLLRCIYNSLAHTYAQSIRSLQAVTGKRYTHIHVIGGGSQDTFLNELTARAAGVPVHAGPVEATALGSIVSQMIAAGELDGVDAARTAIRNSTDISIYEP